MDESNDTTDTPDPEQTVEDLDKSVPADDSGDADADSPVNTDD